MKPSPSFSWFWLAPLLGWSYEAYLLMLKGKGGRNDQLMLRIRVGSERGINNCRNGPVTVEKGPVFQSL